MQNKGNMIVWFIIVVIVIAGFVYLTMQGRDTVPMDTQVGQVEESMNNNTNNNVSELEGIKITTTKEGTGEVAKSGDTVAMNYTGTLLDGTTFDSNVDPKFGHVEPFVFTLGAGQVISGWELGVAGMKVGEKRTLVINPENAYGVSGIPGVIPPNATLTFEVELLGIIK